MRESDSRGVGMGESTGTSGTSEDRSSARIRVRIGAAMLAIGAGLWLALIMCLAFISPQPPQVTLVGMGFIGFLLMVVGAFIAINWRPQSMVLSRDGGEFKFFEDSSEIESSLPQKAAPEDIEERQRIASVVAVPGRTPGANEDSRYQRLRGRVFPFGDRMVPTYFLDHRFTIVDWNEAFSLAFQRTMEGRRGDNAVEWVYYLDNFQEVLDHGVEVFGDANNLPDVDVETIKYTNDRYGKIEAVKRAYKIKDDNGTDILGWLVILDISFNDAMMQLRFNQDLVRHLAVSDIWTEYTVAYDRVLPRTRVYNDLLEQMIGNKPGFDPIPEGARILDLGAGTGNLTLKLMEMERGYFVNAMDNNRAMLSMLRAKCKNYLLGERELEGTPGVRAEKQDIRNLYGVSPSEYDVAILNNVLYSLEEPETCLAEVYQALKTGGEIRISGPKKTTDLNVLFSRIREDLERADLFDRLEDEFNHVEAINRLRLSPYLHRWDLEEMCEMLRAAGFSKITYTNDNAYAGQALIVGAIK